MRRRRRRRRKPSFQEFRKSVATAGCFLWVASLLVSGGCLFMGPPSDMRSETFALWLTGFVGAAVVLLWLYPRQDGPVYVDEEEGGGSGGRS